MLRGTPGDDVICGLAGRDRILGLGGDDVIIGGDGRDELLGGSGDDHLLGGTGADVLTGAGGDDVLDGEAGADSGTGGRGDDVCAADRLLSDCVVDTTGPVIRDIVAPATAAVGVPLTIRWTVVDRAGIAAGWARLGGRSGWMTWCFGEPASTIAQDAESATYEVTCTPPSTFSNDLLGAWIGAVDTLGNWSEDTQTDIQLVGGSDDLEVPELTVPTWTKVLDPQTYNSDTVTSYGGSEVTFDIPWSLRDESGVEYAMVWIYRPYGQGVLGYGVNPVAPSRVSGAPRLVSGTAFDGEWAQEVTFHADEPDGVYTIYLSVGDTVGNRGFVPLGYLYVQGRSAALLSAAGGTG